MFAGQVKIASHSSCRTGVILKIFLSPVIFPDLLSADFFFKINFFRNILSGVTSEWQTVWIQTVCLGYQQMTNVAASKDELIKTFTASFGNSYTLTLLKFVTMLLWDFWC